MPSTHIRPKTRKANVKTTKIPTKLPANDSVDALERKVGSWMGLASPGDDKATSASFQPESTSSTTKSTVISSTLPLEPAVVPTAAQTETIHETKATKKPAGILKKPKYSSNVALDPQPRATTEENSSNSSFPNNKKAGNPVICEQFVRERDPFQKPMRKTRPKDATTTMSHDTIEGYQPSQTHQPAVSFTPQTYSTSTEEQKAPRNTQPNHESANSLADEEEPQIILSSFEELFEAAGNEMPADRNKITPDTKLVEADLSFSVMTQEHYGEKMTEMKREIAQEQQDMYRMFMGNEKVFGDESSGDGEESDDDDDNSEEELQNLFMEQEMDMDVDDYYQDDDDDEVDDSEQTNNTPRAFSLIWGALSRWWTPEAVAWMARLENQSSADDGSLYGNNNWSPHVDRSDIGASRCAGLMAMVKLYLPSSMSELSFPQELQRTAESRIGDWLRTFDYSAEAPKLPVKMWRAISCMLLDMVLVESRKPVEKLPPSVVAVGISLDEYKYLTRSAVQAFQP